MKRICAAAALAASPCLAQHADLGAAVERSILSQPDAEPTTDLTSGKPRKPTFTAYWENDGTYAKPFDRSDRHYTNGFGFELGLPRSYDDADHLYFWPDVFEDPDFAYGFSVKHFMFTPEDIVTPTLIPNDRPYAGLLTGAVFAQRADEHNFDHVQIELGALGGDYTGAEGLQIFVHRVVPNQVNPEGWDNQLTNEFAANLLYQRRWKTERAEIWGLEADAIPLAGFRAGTVYVDAEAAIIGRIGHNVPNDFGPRRLREFDDHVSARDNESWSLYAWGRLGGRAVARNATIQGNLFTQSHERDIHNFVGEVAAGVAFRYAWFEAAWGVTYLTEEFEGQDNGDSYGTVSISANFEF